MDTDHARNPAPPVFASRSRPAVGMAKTQPANDFRAQRATRHSVDGRVDGFVGNLQCGCVRYTSASMPAISSGE